MTQDGLSRLLGVHSLTISKWERGILYPSPWQHALLEAFKQASLKDTGVGRRVQVILEQQGLVEALTHAFEAAGHGGIKCE